MIDYEKVLGFCLEYNISFEEFMLLYTLHMRNQQYKTHLHADMSAYYSNKEIDWVETIKSLESRGFIDVLKYQKDPKVLLVKDLRIADKFVNLLFVEPEDIWEKFLKRYPKEGESPNKNSRFASCAPQANDKEYFIYNILRNADKERSEEILSIMEEMFEFDEMTQKPTRFAQYGISRFIRNWDEMVKQHNENKQNNSFSWSTKVL